MSGKTGLTSGIWSLQYLTGTIIGLNENLSKFNPDFFFRDTFYEKITFTKK